MSRRGGFVNRRFSGDSLVQSARALSCAVCWSSWLCRLTIDSRANCKDCAKSARVISAVDWSADWADTVRAMSIWASEVPLADRSRTRARVAKSSGV